MKIIKAKPFLLLLLAVIMLSLLMSCSSDEKDIITDTNADQEILATNTAEPVNKESGSVFIMSDGSQLYPFFNGYAVIRDNKSGEFAIIDTDGNIIMTHEERPDVFPYHLIFPEGLLIYADVTKGMDNSTFCIMDLEGNILFEFNELDINFERVNLDNYTIEVNKSADTKDSGNRQYGVLDTDGTWIMELTEEYKSVYGVSKNVVLCVIVSDSHPINYDSAVLINTDTGQTLELSNGVKGSISNTLHSRPYKNDGKIIMMTTIGAQAGVYAINEDLSFEMIIPYESLSSASGVGILSGGVFYVSSEEAFFNPDGMKIMDVTKETINFYQSEYTKYPFINDNLLQKVYKDADGSTLYTLTDINDTNMYEPNGLRFYGEISEGLVPVKGEGYVGYIDINGNKVLNLSEGFTEVSGFKNGIAIAYSTQYECNVYIDLNGNILFTDKIQYK